MNNSKKNFIITIVIVLVFMLFYYYNQQNLQGNNGDDNSQADIVYEESASIDVNISYGSVGFETVSHETGNVEQWEIDPNSNIFSLKCMADTELGDEFYDTVKITVEYLDVGVGNFTLLYNSTQLKADIISGQPANIFPTGAEINFDVALTMDSMRQSDIVQLGDTGEWKTKTFLLNDADFTQSIEGADFVIVNYVPSQTYIFPTSLTVRNISLEYENYVENKSQVSGDLVYDIINLADGSTVISESTSIDLTDNEAQSFSVINTFTHNSCYELKVISVENEAVIGGTEFSVMPFFEEDTVSANDVFGVCTHFGLEWFDGDVNLKTSAAALMGAGYIRDEINWHRAETEKGIVNILPEWDVFVDEAIKSGVEPVLILAYGNPYYDEGGPPHTEEGLAAYANYVNTVVEHFEGRVKYFEVWNEYNLAGTAFNSTSRPAEDYAKLLKVAYPVIKEANPDATVIGGAMAGLDDNWIKTVLSEAAYYMDALSYHPYTYPNNPEYGGFAVSANYLSDVMASYNPNLSLWVTEIGWPTMQEESGISEMEAAEFLARSYILSTVVSVDKMFWYDMVNDGTNPSYSEHNFGLLHSWDNEPALAAKFPYLAYNTVSNQLHGAKLQWSDGLSADVFYAMYDKEESGTKLLIVWTVDKEATMTLNTIGDEVKITDILSNSEIAATENGQIQIPVTTSPIFIEGGFTDIFIESFEYID